MSKQKSRYLYTGKYREKYARDVACSTRRGAAIVCKGHGLSSSRGISRSA